MRLRTEAFGGHEAEPTVQYSKRAAVGFDWQAVFIPGLARSGSAPPIPNRALPVAGS